MYHQNDSRSQVNIDIDRLSKVEIRERINYRRKSVKNSHLNDIMQSLASLSKYEKCKS